jgi:hypothetical protein
MTAGRGGSRAASARARFEIREIIFRSLEQRRLMQFVDYQEVLPAKDRVRRSRITDAGRAVLADLTPKSV